MGRILEVRRATSRDSDHGDVHEETTGQLKLCYKWEIELANSPERTFLWIIS